ncbi:MAG: hypothetical protein EB029_04580 [Actinobacteria bacterium]|nr:hypothetical protein [Actinomycetota bacterium]
MRAIQITEFGGPEVMQYVELPDPATVGSQVVLDVTAIGINYADTHQTENSYKAGESVVVHAGAGGVGTIAIQLAKLWGAFVIAVTSSDEKKALCKELGADVVVDAGVEDMKTALISANNNKPVDLVLEMVGGKTFDQSLEALAPFGRLVFYGMASRVAPKMINPGVLMPKSQTVSGFWLVNALAKRDVMQEVFTELFGLIISGKLRPIVGATYPLSQAQQAHRDMLARKTVGKIVLDPAN